MKSDILRHLTKKELDKQSKPVSAEREQRVRNCFNSGGVSLAMKYKDNDPTHGLV